MDTKPSWKTLATLKVRKPRKLFAINSSKQESSAKETVRLYSKSVMNELEQSSILQLMESQSLEEESAKMSEALPEDLYKRVCTALDIPIRSLQSSHDRRTGKKKRPQSRQSVKMPLLSYRKSFTVRRDLDSDTDVETSPRNKETGEKRDREESIHQEFLRRGVREQVTWSSHYLEPEKEDEKGLVKRANDLTDRIAKEFCDYMRQLDGDKPSQLFTPKAVKELFQVEFDTHVARSLRVLPQELSAVPDDVAIATGVMEKSRRSILEREIKSDIEAESGSNKTVAFGLALPAHKQWRAPKNNTRQLWRSAKHIPRDLVTLKTVWEGITNLRSVKEYCRWMIDHPEFRRPPFLKSMGMFDITTLNARLTVESVQPDGSSRRVEDSERTVDRSGSTADQSADESDQRGEGTSRSKNESDRSVGGLNRKTVLHGEEDSTLIEDIRRRLSLVDED